MYAKHRHELRHARKAWPAILVDPRLLSGAACTVYGGISLTDFRKEIRAPLSIIQVHHTKYMHTIIV